MKLVHVAVFAFHEALSLPEEIGATFHFDPHNLEARDVIANERYESTRKNVQLFTDFLTKHFC
jgi:hypothetical protein